MGKGNWFRRGDGRAKGGAQQRGKGKRKSWLSSAASRCALSFETLEDRRVLATFLVTNALDMADDAAVLGSLRWAINQANANGAVEDIIVFSDNMYAAAPPNHLDPNQDPDLFGVPTIFLNGPQLEITNDVRILGPGPRKLAVEGQLVDERVFYVDNGNDEVAIDVEISGLAILGGDIRGDDETDRGGGVYNKEFLLMNETYVTENSASMGGSGIFTEIGFTYISRSLIAGNFNGGVLNGTEGEDENTPSTTIVNSTITRNSSYGAFNRNGFLEIEHSTIAQNFNGGVLSWGNPVPDEPGGTPPDPTVFTFVYSSIFWGNFGDDLARIGVTEDDPPQELLPSIFSPQGYNIVGTGNVTEPFLLDDMGMPIIDPVTMLPVPNPDFLFDPMMGDTTSQYGLTADPKLLSFDNYGGSTSVYLLADDSPAIDMGNPFESLPINPPQNNSPPTDIFFPYSGYEGRGRHFTRIFDYTLTGEPRIDIGAVEMQQGRFVVDTLVDETDDIHSEIFTLDFDLGFPVFTFGNYELPGDFSLREAIEFAALNPGKDIVTFSQDLNSLDLRAEEDLNGGAPTIQLSLGVLRVGTEIEFQGPDNFVLEIDASGNDPSPGVDNGTGTRVFEIDDGSATNLLGVSIRSLTLMGGDQGGLGGAIFNRENLSISFSTFRDNSAATDGGAIYVALGSLHVQGTTFSDNVSKRDGGAIFVAAGTTARISTSTFSGNASGIRGGAIANLGDLVVEYSTITLNTASGSIGHGIVNIGGGAAAQIRSTVIANNGNNISDVAVHGIGALPTSFTSLGYNFVRRGNALIRFSDSDGDGLPDNDGDITPTDSLDPKWDPRLGPLFNSGGIVETHLPLPGSPLADVGQADVPQLITPTAVVSNTAGTDQFPADHLVDNSGLTPVPTYDNYDSAVHAPDNGMNAWVTNNPDTDPTNPEDDYFLVGPPEIPGVPPGPPLIPNPNPQNEKPELVFTLSDTFALSDMVVWGFPRVPDSGNEARWFLVEFSTDGGMTYQQSVRVEHELTSQESETLSFGGVYWADTVRVTVYDNHFGSVDGMGNPVLSGDAVALGEVKFLTNRFDQRGIGFDRVFDGDTTPGKRMDIGAGELQGVTLIVSTNIDENDGIYSYGNLSLREAIELANANPLHDQIIFDDVMLLSLDQQDPTLFLGSGVLTPGTSTDIRITGSVTVTGPGLGLLAIDGSGLDHPSLTIQGSRMFTIDDGQLGEIIEVEFKGLEFRNAQAPMAGAVFHSSENLTLQDVRFINNRTEVVPIAPNTPEGTNIHGGAIYQAGATLTITNGEFANNRTVGLDSDGGAIYVLNGNLEINNTFLTGNVATRNNSDGGGIALKNSHLVANGSFISGNQVGPGGAGQGGGIFADGGTMHLADTYVTGNNTTGANSRGGGIAAFNTAMQLVNAGVIDNRTIGSQSVGAGVFMSGGSLVANETLFAANSTTGNAASGGGIAMLGGTATLIGSTMIENRVSGNGSNGGAIHNVGGTLTVRSSTLQANQASHATSKGGGIYTDTALAGGVTTLIINSTISGNVAPSRGGGIFNADGLLEIKHSTITNNTTSLSNFGAGVASLANSATRTTVYSSIIAGNKTTASATPTDVDFVDGSSVNSFQTLGYNVIGTGNALAAFDLTPIESPASGIPDKVGILNPGLAPLSSNGGLTETHALLANSAAINAGSPSFNPNSYSPALTTDQNGTPRVKQGRIDAGAVESNLVPAIPADFDGDNDVDGRDFLSWQRNLGASPTASKAQGDADGNGVVNAADLAAWKSGFGDGLAGAVAAASGSSSGALFASEAVESEAAAAGVDYTPLAALGVPGSSAQPTASAKASGSQESPEAASKDYSTAMLAWDSTGGYSLLDEEADFGSLLEESDGGSDLAAEDAAFAAWGEQLSF
jgi:predicted outer membrane repeat protein